MHTQQLSDLTATGRTGMRDWRARVSPAQAEAILSSAPSAKLPGDELQSYVLTGDATHLSPPTHDALKRTCKIAKTKMPTPSQAKRIWPRKAAAVLYDAQLSQ